MSNNKQSMKLYTEEQIKNAMRADFIVDEEIDNLINKLTPIELPSDMLCVNCDERKPTHNICMECMIKVGKQNIELPSDEEIEEEAQKQWGNVHRTGVLGFINCAKWMRDKIQGGNNEQQ